tara:strand:+ start:6007 stop:6225 length:219 start_codon:yes stop_codon:yes gene_type:complete
MINSGREWDFMSDEQQIEEILEEANAYGLRIQVKEWAEKFMIANDVQLSKLEVYSYAYDRWIKNRHTRQLEG